MPKVKKSATRIRKEGQWAKVQQAVEQYESVLFVDADNVASLQMQQIRAALRDKGAQIIMGKNTLLKAALTAANKPPKRGDEDYDERIDTWKYNPNIDLILPQLKGNTGLIFADGDLGEIKAVLDKMVRASPAKAGMIAPKDVVIRPGRSGVDCKKTKIFQDLGITTKVQKQQLEITNTKKIISQGEKVTSTQALLLDMLKIYPFSYKMEAKKVLQDGCVYDASVLDLCTDAILDKFRAAARAQTGLSLGLGFPTKLSAPFTVLAGFKNLVAAAAENGYEFKEGTAFLESLKAETAEAKPAEVEDAPAAQVAQKADQEDDDVPLCGLFGSDDEEQEQKTKDDEDELPIGNLFGDSDEEDEY